MSSIDEIMERVTDLVNAAVAHHNNPTEMRRIIRDKEDAALRELAAAALAIRAVGWRPISTVPMDGKPILGWCDHDADDYYDGESGRLTIYGAHCEGVSHVPDGAHVLEWGGAFDDSTWESPGSSVPDWWFRSGSDFEEVANPTHWMHIAEVTK